MLTPSEAIVGPIPEREPIRAAAYRLLREAILDGRIPAGVRVNELELAVAWKISRTPVRDALRRLEAEGLVQSVSGRGVIVPLLTPDDVEELYVLREALEGMAARRAAERAAPADLGHLNGLIKGYGSALKQGDIERLVAIDDDLHRTVARMGQHRRLERAIETVRAQLSRVRMLTVGERGRATKSFREMAKLIAALRARDGARAEASMREHIASLRVDAAAVVSQMEESVPPSA